MRVWAIAANTLREACRQPAYPGIVAGFALLILLSPLYTAFGLGEEGPVVREAGQATIVLGGLVVAILLASRTVWGEIASGTAHLVWTKPGRRAEFLLGKYLGLILVLSAASAVLLAALVAAVGLSEGRLDAHLLVGGGAALAKLIILGGLAVVLSAELPLTGSAPAIAAIFLLAGAPSASEIPGGVGVLRLALPDFHTFEVILQAATARTPIGGGYLLIAASYCILYTMAVLLLGAFRLSRREATG